MRVLNVRRSAAFLLVSCFANRAARAPVCSGFYRQLADVARQLRLANHGDLPAKRCVFDINGIPGRIEESTSRKSRKSGGPGSRQHRRIYIAKPGYPGPDEFAYASFGKRSVWRPDARRDQTQDHRRSVTLADGSIVSSGSRR